MNPTPIPSRWVPHQSLMRSGMHERALDCPSALSQGQQRPRGLPCTPTRPGHVNRTSPPRSASCNDVDTRSTSCPTGSQRSSRTSATPETALNQRRRRSRPHHGAKTGVAITFVTSDAAKRDQPMAVAVGFEPTVGLHPHTLSSSERHCSRQASRASHAQSGVPTDTVTPRRMVANETRTETGSPCLQTGRRDAIPRRQQLVGLVCCD